MADMMGPALCQSCLRLELFNMTGNDNVAGTCAAFPNGIPEDIFYGFGDHREPREGDAGLVYAPDPESQDIFQMWEKLRSLHV